MRGPGGASGGPGGASDGPGGAGIKEFSASQATHTHTSEASVKTASASFKGIFHFTEALFVWVRVAWMPTDQVLEGWSLRGQYLLGQRL